MGYFDEINKRAGGRDLSVRWFRSKIKELGTPDQRQLIREGLVKTRPAVGQMNFFIYSPKYKYDRNVLPYYDQFPLIMPLQSDNGMVMENGSFLGLNFHYLSIPMRLKLLNLITEFATDEKYDESTRFRLTWNRIKRNKLVWPCVKRYLVDHTKSPFRVIDAEDMMTAVLLPVQNFKHATDGQVYNRSRQVMRRPIGGQ
jgi:hypothetical protein